jgi:hypothetical protein
MAFLKILIFTVILLGIAFAAIAVKMFFKKDYEFKKQCSTIDPKTGKRMGCVCGSGGSCHNSNIIKNS